MSRSFRRALAWYAGSWALNALLASCAWWFTDPLWRHGSSTALELLIALWAAVALLAIILVAHAPRRRNGVWTWS